MSAPFNSDQKANISNMKRSLRLDLSQDKGNTLTLPLSNTGILSSPDLNMLKVDTPELENMILQNGIPANTPTPSGLLFPKNVTEEQESFATGFVDALNHLHNSSSNQAINNNSQGKFFCLLRVRDWYSDRYKFCS